MKQEGQPRPDQIDWIDLPTGRSFDPMEDTKREDLEVLAVLGECAGVDAWELLYEIERCVILADYISWHYNKP